jgi:hypothetical protein
MAQVSKPPAGQYHTHTGAMEELQKFCNIQNIKFTSAISK